MHRRKSLYPKEIWIPAQTISSRVHNKNFREFHNNQSLMEILVDKLKKVFPKSKIILSTNNLKLVKKIFSNYENLIIVDRPKNLLGNKIRERELLHHFSSVFKNKNLNENIMIAQCTDPFFNNHEKMFLKYLKLNNKKKNVSLFASYPIKKQTFIENQIINGSVGDWHGITQSLKILDIVRWSCFVSQKKTFLKYGYQIPPNSVPYRDSSIMIDIDHLTDFREATKYYKKFS